jgi:hypothetical protein
MGMEGFSILLLLIVVGAAIILWSLNLRFRRRELQHKERLAALEKGAELPPLEPESQTAPWTPRIYLLRGMVWMFSGIAMIVALSAIAESSHRSPTMQDKILRITDARRNGATEEEIKMLLNDNQPYDRGIPEGLALLGLIPMGVGLAYLVFYRAEGKKLLS